MEKTLSGPPREKICAPWKCTMCGWSQRLLSRSISTSRKWEDSESNFFHEKKCNYVQLPRLDNFNNFKFKISTSLMPAFAFARASWSCKRTRRIASRSWRHWLDVLPKLFLTSKHLVFVFKLYNYVRIIINILCTSIYYVPVYIQCVFNSALFWFQKHQGMHSSNHLKVLMSWTPKSRSPLSASRPE